MNHALNDLTTRAHIEGAEIIPGCRAENTAWRRTRDGRMVTLRAVKDVCTVDIEGLDPFTGTLPDALRFITRNAR